MKNNDAFFKLADGSTNDCLLMADRVHLTWQATNRLAKHLQLNTQGDCISKWKTKRDSQSTRHADSREKDTYAHTSNNQMSGNQTSRPRSANYRSRDQWQSTRQNQHHHTNSRHHNNRRPQTSTTQNGDEWQQCEQQKNETDYWCTWNKADHADDYAHNKPKTIKKNVS